MMRLILVLQLLFFASSGWELYARNMEVASQNARMEILTSLPMAALGEIVTTAYAEEK